ncbi:RES domain-containing protein [Gilliamella sp. WF3-4]|uniref:RES domain-containing protein n=1 Tax=Gilliamella sp. WF3-4 TaxID=3120255 RepID=UPI0021001D71|nr:RES domain-containing protein [Gilliamella apicola]
MGSPPKGTSSAGRANPIGISYLYLANNLETCISEVRPNNASSIYVSKFNINCEDMNILDLTNPKKDTSIMAFEADALGHV